MHPVASMSHNWQEQTDTADTVYNISIIFSVDVKKFLQMFFKRF